MRMPPARGFATGVRVPAETMREPKWSVPAEAYTYPMCRNIRTLYNFDPPATESEIRAASTQFVRKISGLAKPSLENEAAFNAAIDEVTAVSQRLIDSLRTKGKPRDPEVWAARAKARRSERVEPAAPGRPA